MNSPLITVIIPAYNCANFINNAIESVFRQTYSHYELIVVDDGSKDDTASKVLQYGNKLTYIHQKNGGVSKARNTGIKNSKGEYIAFLDADDVWKENKLEVQEFFLRKHADVDFIFSNFHQTKSNTLLENTYKDTFNYFKEYTYSFDDIFDKKEMSSIKDISMQFYYGNIYKYLFLGNFILPSSVIFRRKSVQEVGYFNEFYRVAEETEYFLRFSRKCNFGFVNHPLLYYELPEPDNLSGKKNIEKLIKNALRVQIDSILSDREYHNRNTDFFMRGISNTYCRLSYYYLTEYNNLNSRKYAKYSLKTYKMNVKAGLIFILSFLTKEHLAQLTKFKHYISS